MGRMNESTPCVSLSVWNTCTYLSLYVHGRMRVLLLVPVCTECVYMCPVYAVLFKGEGGFGAA